MEDLRATVLLPTFPVGWGKRIPPFPTTAETTGSIFIWEGRLEYPVGLFPTSRVCTGGNMFSFPTVSETTGSFSSWKPVGVCCSHTITYLLSILRNRI